MLSVRPQSLAPDEMRAQLSLSSLHEGCYSEDLPWVPQLVETVEKKQEKLCMWDNFGKTTLKRNGNSIFLLAVVPYREEICHVTPELQEFLEPQQTLSNLSQSLTYHL